MSGSPNISIVIPTYNRREQLVRVLAGLEGQSIGPDIFEVVVVDDGSTDGTGAWLEAQRRAFHLRTVRQKNGGPARARNAGVEASRGDLLLFLDDDVEPSADLVAEHQRSHRLENNLAVVGPLGSLPSYEQPWVAWEQAKLEAQYAAMRRGDYAPTFRQFWTGNASVRREHVVAEGGFDPAYLRAEDVELAFRLSRRGIQFRFNPQARVLHHASRSLDSWSNAHTSYGRLEVSIFGNDSEEALIKILSENWSRLHPASRWLVRSCAGKPIRYACANFALRRWLEISAVTRPLLSDKVCSALASLLYWQASVQALGPDRTGEVFRRGADIRNGSLSSAESTTR
jgi:GT2 family glycosyltransferase